MKHYFLFLTAVISFVSIVSCSRTPERVISGKSLAEGFADPSDTMQISTYWFWVSDNITKDGIVKDLTAIKQAGIRRVFFVNVWLDEVQPGNVKFWSDEWFEMMRFAFKTAGDLGLEMGIFNSPGWSQTGGPWVRPEESMRYMAYTTARVAGGTEIDMVLERPEGDFEDVRTVAFPVKGGDGGRLTSADAKVSVSPSFPDPRALIDGSLESAVIFTGDPAEVVIDIKTAEAFTARSLKIYASEAPSFSPAKLFAKEGGDYKEIAAFTIDRFNPNPNVGWDPFAPVVISLPATTSNEFRLSISPVSPGSGIRELELSAMPAVERYPEKTFAKMHQDPFPYWNAYRWRVQPETDQPALLLSEGEVVDITPYLDGDRLKWNAPAGEWVVMRTGMKSTGVTNAQSSKESKGLEVDKMSKQHVETFFDSYIGGLLRRIPAEDRKSWKVIVMDSFETGGQNMTDGFLDEFRSRYGYDPVPFLPVFSGFVVGSADISDRFLWDMRRLIADKISYDYVGGLTEIANRNGISTWLENYGHWGYPGEFLQYGKMADELAGEFWAEGDLGNIENRAATSSAHIYGKNQISAESFTSAGKAFLRYPAMVKPRGDRFFSEGINKSLVHLFIHQPYDSLTPGINAPFGTEFNRKNPWYVQFDLFTDYLKRVNFMLQQGRNIADVAYFISEDAPKMTGTTNPELPQGYQFDYINADAIENYLYVKDGMLTLPHGTQYRILVLPPDVETMRPELLSRIEELVNDGAVILGPAPVRSPSLENYPDADAAIKEAASRLWKGIDGVNTRMAKRGKGMVINGMDLREALEMLNCHPDCRISDESPVLYAHRKASSIDIYFLTNQSEEAITVYPEFRVSGKRPEMWEPVTGYIRNLPSFKQTEAGTMVPLKLAPNESTFIVFREKGRVPSSVSPDDNFPAEEIVATLDGPWKLQFESQVGPSPAEITLPGLADLSKSGSFDIRHFAGTIKYNSSFNLDGRQNDEKLFIDFNEVYALAKVWINGKYAGGVWTKPYRLEISGLVKKGANTIEVVVPTSLVNKLIGDLKLPPAERTMWMNVNPWTAESPLQKSGLLGPVKIYKFAQ